MTDSNGPNRNNIREPAHALFKAYLEHSSCVCEHPAKESVIHSLSRFYAYDFPVSLGRDSTPAVMHRMFGITPAELEKGMGSYSHTMALRMLMAYDKVLPGYNPNSHNTLRKKFYREFSSLIKLREISLALDKGLKSSMNGSRREMCLIRDSIIHDMVTTQQVHMMGGASDVSRYRSLCGFDITMNNIKHIKGYDRLVRLGWFHPTSNPGGMVKDHRFSVSNGFKQAVAPNIIGHIVNCEFLTARENAAKYDRNSVSLAELLLEIQSFAAVSSIRLK